MRRTGFPWRPFNQSFFEREPDIRFVFVDDGSRDETGSILERLVDGTFHEVLTLPRNRGKGEAVRHGLQRALEAHQPDYLGFWDADLAIPLDTIPRFARKLEEKEEVDLVTGARVLLCGRRIERTMTRHLCGRVFATAVSTMLGFPSTIHNAGRRCFEPSPL